MIELPVELSMIYFYHNPKYHKTSKSMLMILPHLNSLVYGTIRDSYLKNINTVDQGYNRCVNDLK